LLNSELKCEKDKLEQKRAEMMKCLEDQKHKLSHLKDKQAEVEIRRKEIQKVQHLSFLKINKSTNKV